MINDKYKDLFEAIYRQDVRVARMEKEIEHLRCKLESTKNKPMNTNNDYILHCVACIKEYVNNEIDNIIETLNK